MVCKHCGASLEDGQTVCPLCGMDPAQDLTGQSGDAAASEELFAELGLDLSTAVNLFLRQCIYEDGIPFLVSRRKRTESGFPAEEPQRAEH